MPLAPELDGAVEPGRVAQAEEGDQDPQADGGLAGGDGDGEDGEDLPRQVRPLVGEGDEVQVDRIQDELDRHQHRDHVPAHQDAGQPDREEHEAQHEILGAADFEHRRYLRGGPLARRPPKVLYSRRPRTTAWRRRKSAATAKKETRSGIASYMVFLSTTTPSAPATARAPKR